jgi:hypothetical protein
MSPGKRVLRKEYKGDILREMNNPRMLERLRLAAMRTSKLKALSENISAKKKYELATGFEKSNLQPTFQTLGFLKWENRGGVERRGKLVKEMKEFSAGGIDKRIEQANDKVRNIANRLNKTAGWAARKPLMEEYDRAIQDRNRLLVQKK